MRLRALALAACLACVRGERPAAHRDHGPIVARVGGDAVHADEVAAVARLEGVAPRVALDRIVQARLLAREALAAGAATADDVDDAAWRGRLQLLLARAIEAPNAPDTTPPSYFAEYYQHRRVALHHDGLVRVVHALAPQETAPNRPRVAPAALLARAAALRARCLAEPPGALTQERFEALAREVTGLRFENLPAFDRTGQSEDGTRFDATFVGAAWSLTPASPVSEVVATPFGAHVILRVGAVPPRAATPEQIREAVVREALTVRRSQALAALVERLRAAADVRLSESAVASTGTSTESSAGTSAGAPPRAP